MVQSIEEIFDDIKDVELCKLCDLDCWCQLKIVLYDIVDIVVYIIIDMMDMLFGNYISIYVSMIVLVFFSLDFFIFDF